MVISQIIERILSLPKSIYVNMKLFPLGTAIRLPLYVRYDTVIKGLKGRVSVIGGGRVYFGFGTVGEIDKKYERSILKLNGDILFHSPSNFGHGIRIISEKGGLLKIGKFFHSTANFTISNRGSILIGDDCLFSWNTWLCDTDFHATALIKDGKMSEMNGSVYVGNHVWICANSTVLKGAVIPSGCIVGACSLVKKAFNQENCLLAGNPAIVKKEDVTLIEHPYGNSFPKPWLAVFEND